MRFLRWSMLLVGLVAIVFGVIWTTTIFPKLEKMPADFKRVDDITGSYTIVDPFVQQVQSNAAIQALRANPATLQLMTDPSLQQLMASPAFMQLLANPSALLSLLANPAALAQADPAVRQALSNAAVQKLLADQAVQQLLKDPAALQMLVDPRTLALLADPTAPPTIKVPVKIHRVRQATSVDGNKITLNEQVTTTRTDTGKDLEGYPPSNVNLVVDRHTSQYLAGSDQGRTGYLGLPFEVDKSKTYPVYVGAARGPLDAKYVSTEDLQGLQVLVFQVNEKDRPMGTHPDVKLPMVLDSTITLKAEPHSGRIIDVQDHATTISIVHPTKGKIPLFVSDIALDSASVAAEVEEGKSDRTTLVWLGANMPWIAMILGIVLIAVSTFLGFVGRKKAAATPQAAATPSKSG